MIHSISNNPKILAKLPAREFAARLMALSPQEGLDLLLDRPDAEAVVQAMPEQDFYLFLKDVGGENASSVLGFARLEQIHHILDLECWDRDQVKAGKTLAWLEALLKSSNQKFLEWLYKVDFELLIILFKKWLDVQILPEDVEYCEAEDFLPPDTIDDQFYFKVKYPQHSEFIKSVLSFLFETHHDFYRELMTHIISSLDSDIEELAYRFHSGRLADNAIPDFEEAASIYRSLDPNRLKTNKSVPDDDSHLPPAPFFALMLLPKHNLLTEALARVDKPSLRNTLQIEFASLANKIMVADALAPDDPENLRKSVDRATAYVNLALEEISHGEAAQAASLISKVYIEELFRLGHAKIKNVCQPLQQLVSTGWLSEWPYTINILDQEWFEQASFILAEPPMIFRQNPDGEEGREDLIRTQKDLRQAETIVRMLTALTPLYALVQPDAKDGWDEIGRTLWQKAQHRSLDSVTLGTLVITAAVRKIWRDSWSIAPIPRGQWPAIYPVLTIDKIKAAISQHCKEHFSEKSDIWYSEEYMEPIIQNFKDDLQAAQSSSATSPHLLSHLLFTDK
jgi:hypothetical protein